MDETLLRDARFVELVGLEGTLGLLELLQDTCGDLCPGVDRAVKAVRKRAEKLRRELEPDYLKLYRQILDVCTRMMLGRPLVLTAELEYTLRKLGLNLPEICRQLHEGKRRGFRTKLLYMLKHMLTRSNTV